MEATAFEKRVSGLLKNFTKTNLTPKEAKEVATAYMDQYWFKRLLVFNEQSIFILDYQRGKYVYVSPSIEQICGYSPEELTDIYSLAKMLDPVELVILPKVSEIGLTHLASLNYTSEDLKKVRFSRNNFFIRKDGKVINVLQQSMVIACGEHGEPLLDINAITDITEFNNSPNHFYKMTKVMEDGTEKVLIQGELEQASITPREREIFGLLTQSQTSEEIATQLNISAETVKTHRKNLLKKTKSESSIDLLRYGYAHGWL